VKKCRVSTGQITQKCRVSARQISQQVLGKLWADKGLGRFEN